MEAKGATVRESSANNNERGASALYVRVGPPSTRLGAQTHFGGDEEAAYQGARSEDERCDDYPVGQRVQGLACAGAGAAAQGWGGRHARQSGPNHSVTAT